MGEGERTPDAGAAVPSARPHTLSAPGSAPQRLRYLRRRVAGRGPHPYCEACRRRLLVEGRLRRMPPWAEVSLDGVALCGSCLIRPELQEALAGGADVRSWLGPPPPSDVWERESDRLWREACEAARARFGRYVARDVEDDLRAREASLLAEVRARAPALEDAFLAWKASLDAPFLIRNKVLNVGAPESTEDDLRARLGSLGPDFLARLASLAADQRAWEASVEKEMRVESAFIDQYLRLGPPVPPDAFSSADDRVPPARRASRAGAPTPTQRADVRKMVRRMIAELPELIAAEHTLAECAEAMGVNSATIRRTLEKLDLTFPGLRQTWDPDAPRDQSIEGLRGTLRDSARTRGLLRD